jgi:hypothetical protein
MPGTPILEDGRAGGQGRFRATRLPGRATEGYTATAFHVLQKRLPDPAPGTGLGVIAITARSG